MRIHTIVIAVSITTLTAACGGKSTQDNTKVVSVKDYETRTFTVEAGEGSIEGLLGNVTQDEIERVFSEHRNAMFRCYQDALEDLEEIEGEVHFDIQVASDGSVDFAFISASDLGSVETESCMLDMVKNFHFKRVPGGIAVIYYPMTLEAPYDPPEPEAWQNARVSNVLDEHREEVDACLQGQKGILVTLYVGKGGMVLSDGASGETREAYDCAVCVARAAKSWTFDAPSDDLAKVRLSF